VSAASPTSLSEVLLLEPLRFADDRGYFCETYNNEKALSEGIGCTFVQDNESLSLKAGTIRGLHFQIGDAAQAKLIRVVRGAVFDVAVDIREGSPTYGQYVAAQLSAENGRQLFVPTGFAHGFCTLEPETLVLYKVDCHYDPGAERGIRWDDPELAIHWPFEGTAPILSEKDAALPYLSQLGTCFTYPT
jgi:dTDP-4-dehydrorhamnose 3,5-epimerase